MKLPGFSSPLCCSFLVISQLLWSSTFLKAQVSIQFMPALNGQSVNGLFTAQLQNPTALVYKGKIKITVKDGGNGLVLIALTPTFFLHPGTNSIQSMVAQTNIQFGNSPSSASIAQTGRFPENEYDYCFEFTGAENKPGAENWIFENCYNYLLQPGIPMQLVDPGDGDASCNKRPSFTWQPAMPLVSTYHYQLRLVELKNKQNATDALMNNVPVFQQGNISGFVLNYPQQVQELQQGKKYVWQVIAFAGNTKVNQSEIWQFNVDCGDTRTDSTKESYRQLSGALNGNYYVTGSVLHFSVTNPYGLTDMQYVIIDVSNPAQLIRNLPAIKVQTGLNKVDLPIEDITNMQPGKTYLLKVKNIGDHERYLQFLYKAD